ncbi:uncharacterized protein DUF3253 [Acidipila rosea]|uniref:Uncharacterized protein DUF3253 n=1 Tax=Acidipila rosea TaxID=768535 RepID=A0A4R1LAF4_9BACT|nr:uncharacterized protein DUF3253 [Acidipila rosea]
MGARLGAGALLQRCMPKCEGEAFRWRTGERAILELLRERGAEKTICPSEAARRVAPDNWEPLMQQARAAARRLAAAGEIVVMQGGQRVDPSRAKGPIRLKKV